MHGHFFQIPPPISQTKSEVWPSTAAYQFVESVQQCCRRLICRLVENLMPTRLRWNHFCRYRTDSSIRKIHRYYRRYLGQYCNEWDRSRHFKGLCGRGYLYTLRLYRCKLKGNSLRNLGADSLQYRLFFAEWQWLWWLDSGETGRQTTADMKYTIFH